MIFFFLSCSPSKPSSPLDTHIEMDVDGDGYNAPEDCDDNDAQVHPGAPFTCVWANLPTCNQPLEELLSEEYLAPPDWGSNSYVVPSEDAQRQLASSIQDARQGNVEPAQQAAVNAGYTLCAQESTIIWYASSGSGSSVLALRTHPNARDVVIETPHSFFDLGTLKEGYTVFQNTNARALLASGTHRCASDTISECSGQTRVCTLSSSEPFRISDMAHTDTSFFHAAHMAVADGFPETTIIQLHMFLEPGISVSNGKTRDTTPDSPSARLTDALTEAFPDQLVTSCNDYGAGNHDERICGTSNTQGRHLNGSANPCGEGASEVSGRFIHMEQSRVVIEEAQSISQAIMTAF